MTEASNILTLDVYITSLDHITLQWIYNLIGLLIMKKLFLSLSIILILTSCATLFTGTKSKVQLSSNATTPVNLVVDGKRHDNVQLPRKIKVKNGFHSSHVTASAPGYENTEVTINKKFNGVSILNLTNIVGWGIDAASGAIMKPESKHYYIEMARKDGMTNAATNYVEDPYLADTTIPDGESGKVVSRDNPGETALEQTVIRWYFDSDPRGARIFWRVISSIPAEVKNTNELYLMTTPYEETRSFNILGLTYENSRDVQIEIKVTKKGYMDQVKRFNVRQAIDQQEISSFFELVEAD